MTTSKMTTKDVAELRWFLSPVAVGEVSGLRAQRYDPRGGTGGAPNPDPTTDRQLDRAAAYRRVERIAEALCASDGGLDAWRTLKRAYGPGDRTGMPGDYAPEIAGLAPHTPTAMAMGAELARESRRDDAVERAFTFARQGGLSPMTCALRACRVDEWLDAEAASPRVALEGARRALAAGAARGKVGKRFGAEFIAQVRIEAAATLADAEHRWRTARAELGIRHREDEREQRRADVDDFRADVEAAKVALIARTRASILAERGVEAAE